MIEEDLVHDRLTLDEDDTHCFYKDVVHTMCVIQWYDVARSTRLISWELVGPSIASLTSKRAGWTLNRDALTRNALSDTFVGPMIHSEHVKGAKS